MNNLLNAISTVCVLLKSQWDIMEFSVCMYEKSKPFLDIVALMTSLALNVRLLYLFYLLLK